MEKNKQIGRNPICLRTRKAREIIGIEHDKMAEMLRIDPKRYNKYETRSPIKQEFISKFCKITGILERWLLTGEGPMREESDPYLQELIDIYLKISQEAREAYLEIGRQMTRPPAGNSESS